MKRFLPIALVLASVVSACSESSVVVTTTTTTTLPATSTTVPWVTGAAAKAWNKFVKSYEVLDVSAISKGECGVYAMLITERSLTFYWWDGQKWNDNSAQLAGGKGSLPLKVYSHDFTNDGIIDYFVTYGDRKKSGGSTYGAFFAHKWSGDNMCDWEWVDIDDGRSITKTVESPEVDQRKGLVYADGYANSRWKSYGLVDYLPSSGSFVFQQVFKDKK
ncbi:MAG: hypothetical protein ACO3JF_03085 [Ilumatobacteraceae bacterium]